MPNLTGFTAQNNPEWVTLNFDDGSESHPIHDPSGDYRSQVNAIASKVMGGSAPNPMAGALAQNDAAPLAGNPLVMPTGGAVASDATAVGAPPLLERDDEFSGVQGVGGAARPGQPLAAVMPSAPHAPAPVVGDPSRAIGSALVGQGAPGSFAPPAAPSLVRPAPAAAEARAPAAPDAYAPRYLQTGGASAPSVTRTETHQSEGLSAADKKAVDAANARASEAAGVANHEEYLAKANQVFSDWTRFNDAAKQHLAEKNVADQQERDFTQRVDTQRQKNQQIASRPIDPSEAFAGDAGAYAFMAAFGDALQNFGSALAGKGPVADPSARIESIINRSIQLQTAQKQKELEEGRITADQLEADREHVRFKLATAAKQLIETEEQRAHSADEYKALGSFKKRMDQMQADADAKNAMATARHESTGWSRSVTPGAPAAQGGVDYFLGEDQGKNGGWQAVEKYGERQSGGDQVENAVSRFSKATGYVWDPAALNGAGAFKDKDGKVVTSDHADVPGVTAIGKNFGFLSGEMGREVQGALGDLAAGRAKIADPVGAVSDKSIDAQRQQMAAGTDEGAFRAMENAARQLKGMRGAVDASVSPGVINAARLRRQEEKGFQASRPGLPSSRPATPDALRGAGGAPTRTAPTMPDAPQAGLGEHYSYSQTAGVKPPAGAKGAHAPRGHR